MSPTNNTGLSGDRQSAPWLAPDCERGLVSVVIPTYNRARQVVAALESVRAQTYRPIEVIVVDDGSTDRTEHAISEWVAGLRDDDPRFQYAKNTGKGAPAARNTGLRQSRGEYLALLDSDDEWLPSKIALQVERLARSAPSVGLVYTGAIFVSPAAGESVAVPSHRGFILRELLRDNVIIGSASGALIRRRVLCDIGGFDVTLPAAQDHELWIRLGSRYEVDFVSEPLVRISMSDDDTRISNNFRRKLDARNLVFAKHAGLMRTNGLDAEFMRRTAWHCQYMIRDHALARRMYARALRLDVLAVRAYAGLLSTLVPHRFLMRIRSLS